MTSYVESLLTYEIMASVQSCRPEEIFSECALKRWARSQDIEAVADHYDLEYWAEDNGWVEEENAPAPERVVKDAYTLEDLCDFVRKVDAEKGDWEFTRRMRDWFVAEMAKHEAQPAEVTP